MGGGDPKRICLQTGAHPRCTAAVQPTAQVSPLHHDATQPVVSETSCPTCREEPRQDPFESRDMERPVKLVWCTHESFVVCLAFNRFDAESRRVAASMGVEGRDELWFEFPHGGDREENKAALENLWAEWNLVEMPVLVNPAKMVTWADSDLGEDLRELRYFLRRLDLDSDLLGSYLLRDHSFKLPAKEAHTSQTVVNT